jgi:hypothetical protein
MSSPVQFDHTGAAGSEGGVTRPPAAAAEQAAAVTGRVRRSDGVPLAGAGMTVIDTSGRQCGLARTDSDGRYRCRVPGAGEYLVVCASPPYRPDAMRIVADDAGATCNMVVAAAASVSGRVLRAGTSTPVPDAVLILIDERGSAAARGVSDESGRYRLADLPEGRYTLTACYGDHDPVAIGVVLPTADTLTQDVVLTLHTVLAGTVRSSATGLPLPESLVTVLDPEGHVVAHTCTGRDGTFSVPDLRENDYTVIASGYPPSGILTSVRGGVQRPVELTLGESQE